MIYWILFLNNLLNNFFCWLLYYLNLFWYIKLLNLNFWWTHNSNWFLYKKPLIIFSLNVLSRLTFIFFC